jgi:O-antigen ligase/tetratricopeptide (TPR) repeat protein
MAQAASTTYDTSTDGASAPRARLSQALQSLIEAVVLVLVIATPWAFGTVDYLFESMLYAGVAGLALLWGLRMLVEGRLALKKCPVYWPLLALILLGAWQLVALPAGTLEWISPGTAHLRETFLPAEAEAIVNSDGDAFTASPDNLKISLYPFATRRVVFQLMAFLLVFAIVRNNLDPAGALKRLSVAAVINGLHLSVFALIQFFSSDANTVFWHFHTEGRVFGPFICRNHFPFYVNICFGLGLGLLLSFQASSRRSRHDSSRARRPSAGRREGLAMLLQRPRTLWVCAALALMASSAVLSLSRGGTVALVAAVVVFIVLKGARLPRTVGTASTLAVVLLALCLLLWFGWQPVQARLATLWKGDALAEEGRWPMWLRMLPVARDFPVWGAGYGAFDTIEPLNRPLSQGIDSSYEYAHNDYLEALLEGGVPRLVLTLVVIVLVYGLGWHACRRYQGRSAGALALGALAAFTTVVVHSAVDFGLHIPAIALLTAVVMALLAGLGAKVRPSESGGADQYVWRLGGLAPVAGMTALAVSGALLVQEDYRREHAARRQRAVDQARMTGTTQSRQNQIRHLRAAVDLTPQDAELHSALGDVYALQYEATAARLKWDLAAGDAVQMFVAFLPAGGAAPQALAIVPGALARTAQRQTAEVSRGQAAQRYLPSALRCYLRARDLCPLLARPQQQLAAFRERLQHADSRRAYLERAQRLLLPDGETAYVLGDQCLLDGAYAEAWQSWRHSLECSDHRFKDIVQRASKHLDAEGIVRELLPPQPFLLYRAAFQLYPDSEPDPRRRVFLEEALALLERQSADATAKNFHLKARVNLSLERPEEALKAYRIALIHAPGETAWRYEYAQLLFQEGHLEDAMKEVKRVLSEQPGNAEAKALHRAVFEKLVESP